MESTSSSTTGRRRSNAFCQSSAGSPSPFAQRVSTPDGDFSGQNLDTGFNPPINNEQTTGVESINRCLRRGDMASVARQMHAYSSSDPEVAQASMLFQLAQDDEGEMSPGRRYG
jgi:hypothetical protein